MIERYYASRLLHGLIGVDDPKSPTYEAALRQRVIQLHPNVYPQGKAFNDQLPLRMENLIPGINESLRAVEPGPASIVEAIKETSLNLGELTYNLTDTQHQALMAADQCLKAFAEAHGYSTKF